MTKWKAVASTFFSLLAVGTTMSVHGSEPSVGEIYFELANTCVGQPCEQVVKKTTLTVGGVEREAVEIRTLDGSQTVFRIKDAERETFILYCFCNDCVSIDYSYSCVGIEL